jgi:hypothetical protein
MDIDRTDNMYMLMMCVYLKAYEEALKDFEDAVKNVGFADLALMAVQQKLKERKERVAREMSDRA